MVQVRIYTIKIVELFDPDKTFKIYVKMIWKSLNEE